MDADTAALFPDKLVDSELGPIPEGWRVASVPEAIDVSPKRSIPKAALAPYLEMKNMPTSLARVVNWTYRKFTSGTRFTNGDVLVARITPCLENGKTAFVDFLKDNQIGWGSTEYIVLRSKPPLPPEYSYFLVRSDEFRSYAIANMTGTSGRQRVPVSCLYSLLMAVPPGDVAEKFGQMARTLLMTMKQRDEESSTLATARDMVLPKLLAGDIRLTQSQIFVEAGDEQGLPGF